MAFTAQNAQDDLAGITHGTTLSEITNLKQLINRAGRQLLLDIDPPETKRVATIGNGLFDGVYDYGVPSDLKGEKIIDIRPRGNRVIGDNFTKALNEDFDLYKTPQDFTIEFRDGTKTVRISKSLGNAITFDSLDNTTGNGTWSAAGGASALAQDTIEKIKGSALSFDVGSSGGYIENSALAKTDFTLHLNKSSWFVYLYIPDSTKLTSVDLRWGVDSSNFYNRTITAPHYGSFLNGWNIIRFDWSGATKTGNPDTTANLLIYQYARITVNTTAALSAFRVDELTSKIPSIYEMLYYSKFLFRSTGGTWKEVFDANNDIINLDTESYNLLINKMAVLAAQQQSGGDSSFDYQLFEKAYLDGIKTFQQTYKSEVIPQRDFYYRFPGRTYRTRGGSPSQP